MPGAWEILPIIPSSNVRLDPRNATAGADERAWQKHFAEAIRDLPTLLHRVGLADHAAAGTLAADSDFPVLVPESYLRRIRPGDPRDPLLLQVLPQKSENIVVDNFTFDPLQEDVARIAPGLLHKYHGRALLIAHGSCAVHCRYCFRRHFPYQAEPQGWEDWQPALAAIRRDATLQEILLSGGDPLILSNRRLQQLLEALAAIPHVRRVRIHSRLPVVLPDRVTSGLMALLKSTRLRVIMVIHANHARELTADCAGALEQLVEAGFMVLNQAVLLRGVNDSVEALVELCERCIDLGVSPYYLHQLDQVRGAAHFEVPVSTGQMLIREIRKRLPGYAVPRYVWEEPGGTSKMPLESDFKKSAVSSPENHSGKPPSAASWPASE